MRKKPDTFYPWDEGRPTKPEVDALMVEYGEIGIGERVEYSEVSAVIGAGWKDGRFKTVTVAWRKRMMEKGRVLECIPGEAFYVADAAEVSSMTDGVIAGMGRKARRHRHKLAAVPVVSEEQRAAVNHHGLLMRRIEEDSRRNRMNTVPNTEVRHPPRALPEAAKV